MQLNAQREGRCYLRHYVLLSRLRFHTIMLRIFVIYYPMLVEERSHQCVYTT